MIRFLLVAVVMLLVLFEFALLRRLVGLVLEEVVYLEHLKPVIRFLLVAVVMLLFLFELALLRLT